MDREFSLLVAAPVMEPALSRLSRLQESLRPPQWRITIGPHITLVAPGQALLSIAQARDAFASATAGFESLSLYCPRLGKFTRRGLSTIYLEPESSISLIELQQKLVKAASAWQDISRSTRRPFVGHITLVSRLPEASADQVLSELSLLPPIPVELGRVSLFAKRLHDKSWLELL